MTVVTATNGRKPASSLAAMPGRNGDGTQQTAERGAVASYGRLRRDMLAAGMGDLLPSNGFSCYRTLAAQQHMRNIGLTTIAVGRSIHGEALAVDYASLGGFAGARHRWLRANAGRYGWAQPGWAQQGGSLPEPWHWEYTASRDQHRNERDEPMSAAELAAILAGIGNLENILAREGGDGMRGDLHQAQAAIERVGRDVHTVADETRHVGAQVGEVRAMIDRE
jgi:hypothetical protein